jgi:hypothetical protein
MVFSNQFEKSFEQKNRVQVDSSAVRFTDDPVGIGAGYLLDRIGMDGRYFIRMVNMDGFFDRRVGRRPGLENHPELDLVADRPLPVEKALDFGDLRASGEALLDHGSRQLLGFGPAANGGHDCQKIHRYLPFNRLSTNAISSRAADRVNQLSVEACRQHDLKHFDVVAMAKFAVADTGWLVHTGSRFEADDALACIFDFDPALEDLDQLELGPVQMRLA